MQIPGFQTREILVQLEWWGSQESSFFLVPHIILMHVGLWGGSGLDLPGVAQIKV